MTSLPIRCRVGLCVWLLLSASTLNAQTQTAGPQGEEALEQYISETQALPDGQAPLPEIAAELEEQLRALAQPVDLNQASLARLASLPGVDWAMAARLITHRERCGPYLAVAELNAVAGLSPELAARIAPYCTVAAARPLPWYRAALANRAAYGLVTVQAAQPWQPRPGWAGGSAAYEGGPAHWSMRLRSSEPGRYSVGFVAEKDAGERFTLGAGRAGADYYSGHLYLAASALPGRWRALALGDYQLLLGQGLVAGQGYQVGRGSDATGPVYRPPTGPGGIAPYTSLLEGYGLRGAAATRQVLAGPVSVELTALASYKALDAQVLRPDTTSPAWIELGPRRTSGLHRSPSEQATRATGRELALGAALTYQALAGRLSGGVAVLGFGLTSPITSGTATGYAGAGLANATHWGTAYLGPACMFYEVAASQRGAGLIGQAARNLYGLEGRANTPPDITAAPSAAWQPAGLVGVRLAAGRSTELAALLRHYGTGFESFYGSGFSARGRAQGEAGAYLGITQRLPRSLELSAWADVYRLSQARQGSSAPGAGRAWLLRLAREQRNAYRLWAELRQDQAPRDQPTPTQLQAAYRADGYTGPLPDAATSSLPLPTLRRYATLGARIQLRPWLLWDSQVLTSRYAPQGRPARLGIAAWQGVQLQSRQVRLQARYCLFDADGYQARLYTLEQGLPQTWHLQSLYGQGTRWYAVLRLRPEARTQLGLEVASTRRQGQPRAMQVGVQVRWGL